MQRAGVIIGDIVLAEGGAQDMRVGIVIDSESPAQWPIDTAIVAFDGLVLPQPYPAASLTVISHAARYSEIPRAARAAAKIIRHLRGSHA